MKRAGSAASHMFPGMIDEDYLAEAEIIHLTGITPVLGDSCKRMVEAVMDMAKRHHRLISFDPNIRKKLWKNCDYASMLRDMTLQAQIVLLGMDEADTLFGIDAPGQIMDILFTKGNAQYVAVKNGAKGAYYVGKKRESKQKYGRYHSGGNRFISGAWVLLCSNSTIFV